MGRVSANNVNDVTLMRFKALVRQKHGKLHTVYSQELERAMNEFIARNASGGTRTHPTNLTDFEKPDDGRCNAGHHKAYKVIQMVKELGMWDSKQYPEAVVVRYIKKEIGLDPARTVARYNKYIRKLWEFGE